MAIAVASMNVATLAYDGETTGNDTQKTEQSARKLTKQGLEEFLRNHQPDPMSVLKQDRRPSQQNSLSKKAKLGNGLEIAAAGVVVVAIAVSRSDIHPFPR